MSFQEPTYEEYQRANDFARFKYKYGFVVTLLCLLCLLLLLFFVFKYAKELSTNPLVFGAAKYNVDCRCYNYNDVSHRIEFFVNSTSIWVPEINDYNSIIE